MYRKTRAVVDLTKIKSNIEYLRSKISPSTRFLAVIKANAYGHGLLPVAKYLQRTKAADYFGIAIPEEGLILRKNGINLPILILGPSDPVDYDDIIQYDLIPTVFSRDAVIQIQKSAENLNKTCRIHLKVDSGMNRIGFKDVGMFRECVETIINSPNVILDGIFTHFAVSEETDSDFTEKQVACFSKYVDIIHSLGLQPLVHCANSGAIQNFPEYQYDMVRGGISIYGYHPLGKAANDRNLKPALTWKTEISHLKTIHEGESVSYGRHFIAAKDTMVATIPVGYGDGYKRCLSNLSFVLIHGVKVPVIGNVCMDQLMADVSAVEHPQIGDEVILIGHQGNSVINADDLSELADTISYEILLSINDRVPRDYIE